MNVEALWLERIFWLMVIFLVMLGVDIGLLTWEIRVLKRK